MTPTFIYLSHILDKNIPRYIVMSTFFVVGGVLGGVVHFEYSFKLFQSNINQIFGQNFSIKHDECTLSF